MHKKTFSHGFLPFPPFLRQEVLHILQQHSGLLQRGKVTSLPKRRRCRVSAASHTGAQTDRPTDRRTFVCLRKKHKSPVLATHDFGAGAISFAK